jgi:calcineurin-like phosphoesterase family protein
MNKIWFTSDLHFSHNNIHKFCPRTRPDADIAVMNNKMVHRWNTQVQPGDVVWSLGDMFFGDEKSALDIMRRLNGEIHLVYGNHDQTIRKSDAIQKCFASIHEYKEVSIDGVKICLFHYPIYEWNKIHHGAVHFHGHIHERLSGVPGKILNVCLDSPTFGDGTYSLYDSKDLLRHAANLPVRPHGKGEVEL